MSHEIINDYDPWWHFCHPRYWPTWLLLGVLRVLVLLPYVWILKIGQKIGGIGYYFAKKRRHITEVNLRLCFPHIDEKTRTLWVKECFMSTGIGVLEMAMSWWWPLQRLRGLITFKGEEHLQAAINTQRGVLALGSHFTTLDLIGRLMALDHEFYVTYRNTKNRCIDALMQGKRQEVYAGSIHRHDIKRLLRVLKNKGVVWFAPDQDYGRKHSVFAPFFGVPAATLSATARIAQMTGAVVLPSVQYRLPDGKGYLIEVLPAIENFPSSDPVIDATRINQYVEYAILQVPTQYLWQHRRFKTTPDGGKGPYT